MKALIVAGGKGEWMRTVADGLPKPFMTIGERSIVEHQLLLFRRYEIRHVILAVSACDQEVFRSRLGNGEKWGIAIDYHIEREPLGTAGSLSALFEKHNDEFLVLYGDVMVHMDLDALIRFHQSRRAAATLVVHPTDHPLDSDLVDLEEDGRIRAFHPKPRPPHVYCRNVGNAGMYVISPQMARFVPKGSSDFIRDVFPPALMEGEALFGYRTREYLKDTGTPERHKRVNADWSSGRIERLHRDHALPAIFFDRDGTLCEFVPLLSRVDDMRLIPGATEAIRRVNRSDYLAVVITNQPVIAYGLCSLEEVNRIHARMEMLLGEAGALLDAIYFCPHHPDPECPGDNPKYKISCECRKPGLDLVHRAVRDLNIDLARSIFVGDATADIETGKRLNLRTFLVETGKAGRDKKYPAQPNARCAHIQEVVQRILANE